MLRISPRQMGQFEADARRRYVRAMARHLRTRFTERAASLSDERLEALVETGMEEAGRHGVIYKDDIRRYLEYMVIYGAPLDERPQVPWIGRILQRTGLSGTQKLRLIGEHELAMVRAGA
jgi:hypothetical protein